MQQAYDERYRGHTLRVYEVPCKDGRVIYKVQAWKDGVMWCAGPMDTYDPDRTKADMKKVIDKTIDDPFDDHWGN